MSITQEAIDRVLAANAVQQLHALKLPPVLLGYGTKRPAFPDWQNRLMEIRELAFHTRKRAWNVGIHLGAGQLVVIDKDTTSGEADDWLRAHGIFETSPMSVETAHGGHDYFRLPETVKEVRTRIRLIEGIDVLMGARIAVAPPSWIADTDHRYLPRTGKCFLPPGELPLLPDSVVELLNAETKPVAVARLVGRPIETLRAYIGKAVAASGAGGHNTTFRVACRLADAGLSEEQVLAELVLWNETNAEPPWSHAELEHKARDAVRRKK